MKYKPKYFTIEELVSKETLDLYGEKKCWLMLDDRILKAFDMLRDKYGRIVVNNWATGGNRTESGLRVPGMKYYSPTSQHSFGRALDGILLNADLATVQRDIITDRDTWSMITGLERGKSVTWLHGDCRNDTRLQIFDC